MPEKQDDATQDADRPPGSDLGLRIRRRRQDLGLSPSALAQRTEMSEDYLCYVEQSPTASIGTGPLLRLAKALETTPEFLAGGAAHRPPGRGRPAPHRDLRTLTDEQCWAYLAPGGVGRVVFVDRGRPLALPVNFVCSGRSLLFRTTEAMVESIAANSIVTFEVDQIDEAMSQGWSVLATGHIRRLRSEDELRKLRDLHVEPWAGGAREHGVQLDPYEISGRAIREA
jgi:nitroimidazol reductase NimA-like FMN-containing flavoprotein (pyridoxamine 5'-phosphate oxidase superfamily)